MKTVVITGGSRGIGAAAVERFAAKGHRVYFLYEKNHAAAKAVAEKTGATAICCDVSDGAAVKAAFRQIPDVDVLICNAGISMFGLLSDLPQADWDRIFAVNVGGVYHCVQAAMPFFLKKQAGAIVTVSSMWGQVGASCEAAYSATKGAVIALTKALVPQMKKLGRGRILFQASMTSYIGQPQVAGYSTAKAGYLGLIHTLTAELAEYGITVNAIAPGWIDTPMFHKATDNDAPRLAKIMGRIPAKTVGDPMDVGMCAAFLCSEAARYISGTCVPVDGGALIGF